MAGNLGEEALVTIDSITQGHKTLEYCKSSKVADGQSREPKNALGGFGRPVGTVRKPGALTITLDVFAQQGTPEVDWWALQDSGEVFGIFREIVGGRETHYPQVQVSKVDEDDDGDNADHMITVELLALDRENMPS